MSSFFFVHTRIRPEAMSKRGKEPTTAESEKSVLPRIPMSIMAAMSHITLRKPLALHSRKPRSSKSGRTRRDMKVYTEKRHETIGPESEANILPRGPLERLLRVYTARSSDSARRLFARFVHHQLHRILFAGGRIKVALRDCRRLMPRHCYAALKAADALGLAPPGSFPLARLEARH
jgi:hypothetical protein